MGISRRDIVLRIGVAGLMGARVGEVASQATMQCPPGTRIKRWEAEKVPTQVSGEVSIDGKVAGGKAGGVGFVMTTREKIECEAPPPPPPPPPPRRSKGSGYWDVEVFNRNFGGMFRAEADADLWYASNLFIDYAHPGFAYIDGRGAQLKVAAYSANGSLVEDVFALRQVGSGFQLLDPNRLAYWKGSVARDAERYVMMPLGVNMGASTNGAGNGGIAIYLAHSVMVGTSFSVRATGFNTGGTGSWQER